MARDPRRKSIIVGICLISFVFAVLFSFNYSYQQYWSDQSARQMVSGFARSEVDPSQPAPALSEAILAESMSLPVLSIIVSQDGSVLSKKMISGSGDLPVAQATIQQITENDPGEWKQGPYVYSSRKLNNEETLIVLTNARIPRLIKYRLATCAALSAGESVLLAPISIYLARIVARPSRRTMRREQDYVSDASHELKTSLGAIGINAQALATDIGENVHLNNILSETKNMSRLTERLLTLSQIEESHRQARRFSLSSTVEEVALSYAGIAYEKGLDYTYHIEEGLSLTGIEDDIKQLATILLDNAVKYTDGHGRITMDLRALHQKHVLTVSNTGPGIADDDLPHIFERFYTSDASGEHHSFGLGLAIAKAIADNHGARISADSTPGALTTFRVSFPL